MLTQMIFADTNDIGGLKHGKNQNRRYIKQCEKTKSQWHGEELYVSEVLDDPMNDPQYNPQDGSDTETLVNDLPETDEVWLRRQGSDTACKELYEVYDDDVYDEDYPELQYKETVLDGPEYEDHLPLDHYDLINESDLDDSESETELKKPAVRQRNLPQKSPQTKHKKRRRDYELMVKIFQPLLVANVIVKRLLPHLPFLADPDKIRAIEDRDPRAAVVYLIDELCSNCQSEPGRWTQFIQALEKCGYKNIVDTLREEEPVDHTYQKEYLKIITPILRDLIYPLELLPFLWAVNVISNEDKEEVVQIERNWGPTAAADKLLNLVPRRHKHWYSHLVDALRAAGRTEAVEILDIPEILDCYEKEYETRTAPSVKQNKIIPAQTSKHEVNQTEVPLDEYVNTKDQTEVKVCTSDLVVRDNCEYLECDSYSDIEDEGLDEMYLSMRDSTTDTLEYEENIVTMSKKTHEDPKERKPICFGDILDENSAGNSSPLSKDLVEDGEINQTPNELPTRIEPNSRDLHTNGDTADKGIPTYEPEHEARYLPGSDRYEPPLPTSIAPETPEQNNMTVDVELYEEMIDEDTTDGDDVEVRSCLHGCNVKTEGKHRSPKPLSREHSAEILPALPPRKRRCYNYWLPNTLERVGSGLNKSPKPTPRKQSVRVEGELVTENDFVGSGLNKSPKPTPRKQSVRVEGELVTENDFAEGQGRLPKPLPREHSADILPALPPRKRRYYNHWPLDTQETDLSTKSEREKLQRELSDISETLGEDRHSFLKSDKKRSSHVKFNAYILERKKKWKKLQRFKIKSSRTPLNKYQPQDAKCLDFDRRKALVSRDRLGTPRLDRKHNGKQAGRHKVKPSSLGDEQSDTENELSKIQDKENCLDSATCHLAEYSEPFRDHRGKEDEDIFATLGQARPNNAIGNNVKLTDVLIHSHGDAKSQSVQRKLSDTDELLGILEGCKLDFEADDCLRRSNTEIKTVTTENLNPELRKKLEKVRDLEIKLNTLVHVGKVMKKQLQLQEDVNEVLKQIRHLSSNLNVKEKEDKAFEAAINGEVTEMTDANCSPYNSEVIDTSEGQGVVVESPVSGRHFKSIDLPVGRPDADHLYVKGGFDETYKDSAFYSKYTTKL